MQFSQEQVQDLNHSQVHQRAAHWKSVADRALPPAQRDDPLQRLRVLAGAVAQAQGAPSAWAGVDVRQTALWLERALAQGAAWQETRAVALLHGAAALGAMWFLDARLLDDAMRLPIQASQDDTLRQLLTQPQGLRYKRAAMRELQLRAGLRAALRRALAAELAPAELQALVAAAFAPHPDDGNDAQELDVEEQPPATQAEQYLARERALLAQAGVADPRLATLGVAGDLVLGLGRCARLLAPSPEGVRQVQGIEGLKELLHGLA